jgi:hypothetical protein
MQTGRAIAIKDYYISGGPIMGIEHNLYLRFYSVGRFYCAWFLVLSPFWALFFPQSTSRAYASLTTVLAIVHFGGTHPIPPQ